MNYLKRAQLLCVICTVCEQPAALSVMVHGCHACVNSSRLRSSGLTPTLRSGSSPSPTRQRAGHTHARNYHTYIHTTSANAVTLVWGSLRLAPTSKALPSISGLYTGTKPCPVKAILAYIVHGYIEGTTQGHFSYLLISRHKLLMISKWLLLFQVALNWGYHDP